MSRQLQPNSLYSSYSRKVLLCLLAKVDSRHERYDISQSVDSK